MILHRRDIPLIGFLNECNKSSLKKKILDCGAGGQFPPLAIFFAKGYECHGIELSEKQIEAAQNYVNEHKKIEEKLNSQKIKLNNKFIN